MRAARQPARYDLQPDTGRCCEQCKRSATVTPQPCEHIGEHFLFHHTTCDQRSPPASPSRRYGASAHESTAWAQQQVRVSTEQCSARAHEAMVSSDHHKHARTDLGEQAGHAHHNLRITTSRSSSAASVCELLPVCCEAIVWVVPNSTLVPGVFGGDCPVKALHPSLQLLLACAAAIGSMFRFNAKDDVSPKDQVKQWKQKIRKEKRGLERQIRGKSGCCSVEQAGHGNVVSWVSRLAGIEREENKVKREIKKAAKKVGVAVQVHHAGVLTTVGVVVQGDMDVVKTLAKELVRLVLACTARNQARVQSCKTRVCLRMCGLHG